jgi:hypothetical protein
MQALASLEKAVVSNPEEFPAVVSIFLPPFWRCPFFS